jgi:hypothetical protein
MQAVLAAMPEGSVPDVMGKRYGFYQVLVKPEGTGKRPPQLGHLKGMGKPGPEMVPLVGHKNLGLLFEPPESAGVDDPVAVMLERGSEIRSSFWKSTGTTAADSGTAFYRIIRQCLEFPLFKKGCIVKNGC